VDETPAARPRGKFALAARHMPPACGACERPLHGAIWQLGKEFQIGQSIYFIARGRGC
jgi:hypothetical protein